MRRTMRRLGPVLRDAWFLSIPYFRSEERWIARGLLLATVALNLALVGMTVLLNFWNGAFFDSIQARDWHSFIQLIFFYKRTAHGFLPGFCGIAVVYILISVYSTFLNQWLQIRWRRWLTRHYLDDWMGDRTYYRMSLTGRSGDGTDNPDQRISEDIRDFVTNTLSLGLDLLSNAVTLVSFIGILWTLSGAIEVFGVRIPGYMVWVALLYALVGTWLTHLIGRPLARLSFNQQRVEADFRFALVRLRENTEGVALYKGEAEERGELRQRFTSVVDNWWAIMRRTKALNTLTSGYGQVAGIFPLVVASPRYFSGAIQLGALTRISDSFGQVQSAMSWFVSNYATLASWSATVERLGTFQRAIQAARTHAETGPTTQTAGQDLVLEDVTLRLPDGRVLMEGAGLRFRPGESTVITGASGSGKSTLFRALAGIWPYADGRITLPAGHCMFLPQRPYLPLGTLHRVVTYPAEPGTISPADLAAAMTDCGLGALLPQLEERQNWSLALSGGEQQRVAIVRALLLKPDWLFLDEATANLDPDAEQALYAILHERLPKTTVISIAHRESVAKLHDRRVVLTQGHLSGSAPVPEAAE
ncbi:ABC transporter ATP-binding protein/permease [Acidisoma cladoniae]|jgi:putative ATP-binding cassette transporter|uniref:ABC transporter ATP-binding protein/permease n=1 Tax=Acidisoma cladoniae TaxID=3040935 RepID=UPI0025506678|nr:ABC transporter ATP-binding protein/permease [Acidisoma sp. PAMC 29798]